MKKIDDLASLKHSPAFPATMSTLTLAPTTIIFTGATLSDVYEQITLYVAKNAVKHLYAHKETVIPAPDLLPPHVANIPTIPIHHYVPAPAPAPAPTLTPNERVIQDLKAAMEKCDATLAAEYKNLIKQIDTAPESDPYLTLITNKKYVPIYDTLFNSINTHFYKLTEASATQKEKDRKAAILAALQEKFNSYPSEKTWQREAYKQIIQDVTSLPSNTDSLIYHNLKGVGNSISDVIFLAYNKYK